MAKLKLAKCKAKTKAGRPCPNAAGESGYCFTHDPARGKERAEARKRGGERHRTPHGATDAATLPTKVRTLDDVLSVLDYALAEAMPLENSVQRGRLIVTIAHAFIEAIKTGELEQRLAAIESALKLREAK
jgi:hypothetical protein